MVKLLDPHLHLFDLKKGQYGWLRAGNPPHWPDKAVIARDFSEADLTLSENATLAGFVHIEAGFDNAKPWREIAWLEQTCTQPFKSIGCVDLTLSTEAFSAQLEKLTAHASCVGVRHILDDDAVALLSKVQVLENLRALEQHGLIFEAQFDVSDSEAVNAFLAAIKPLTGLSVVLNHAGFAPETSQQAWLTNIDKLATLTNLSVKASGWEMVSREYAAQAIEARVSDLLDAFGEERVMLASNFPLTLFRTSYAELWQTYLSLNLPEEQIRKLIYENTHRVYRF